MTSTPFASLEMRLACAVNARLSNAECSASGVTFLAMLDITDRTAYDTVTVGDYSLRYLTADVVLEPGESVMVSAGPLAGEYMTAEAPARINAFESVVGLVRA